MIEIYSNSILVLDNQRLVLFNCPELTDDVKQTVRSIESEYQVKMELIVVVGDWHHFHIPTWMEEFSTAHLKVCSQRNLLKQPSLEEKFKDRIEVIDYQNISVPALGDNFELVSFSGCIQPPWMLGGDENGAPRIELVALFKTAKILYITDHVFCPTEQSFSGGLMGKVPGLINCNKGGFRIGDS